MNSVRVGNFWAAAPSGTPAAGGDLQALRGQNRMAVLNVLRSAPAGVSVSSIHEATALSRPTVKLAVAGLMADGTVIEAELGASTARGGRPGRRYQMNPVVGVVVGAVIGLEYVEVAISDIHGALLARSVEPPLKPSSFRERIVGMLHALRQESSLEQVPVMSITIGVIGIVTPGGNVVRNEGLAEIAERDYFQMIGDEFACPVFVDNDANLAASAEFASLGRSDVRDMVGLHADVAIGCGLILDSKLHRGYAGAAGELGFSPVLGWRDSHEPLREIARTHSLTVAGVFESAGEGAAWAVDAVQRFAESIAPGVLALVLTVNPQVIVIGGAICGAGDAFRLPLVEIITSQAPAAPDIVFSSLGSDCILLGALHNSQGWAWDELLRRAYREAESEEAR